MKLNKILWTVVLGTCLSAASAFAWPDHYGSHYEWRGDSCAEVAGNGSVISWPSNDVCRQFLPTHNEWRGDSCAEVSPAGVVISWPSNDVCRQVIPTHYNWRGDSCAELTPADVVVSWPSNDVCRRTSPTHYEWRGSSCAEVSPYGVVISWPSNDRCRYAANDAKLEDFTGALKGVSPKSDESQAVAELESAKSVKGFGADTAASERKSAASQQYLD